MYVFSKVIVLGLAAVALAAPRHSDINSARVNGANSPSVVVSVGPSATLVNYNAGAVEVAVEAPQQKRTRFWNRLLRRTENSERSLEKRYVGDCAAQPIGSGPISNPDTPAAFLAFASFAASATRAFMPSGYTKSYTNLQAASISYGSLGFTSLASYDPAACAKLCDTNAGCVSFNICKFNNGRNEARCTNIFFSLRERPQAGSRCGMP